MSVSIDLRLGDCLEVLRELPDGCVDACITDPPYGTGERLRVEGKFVDTRQAWDEWDVSWITEYGSGPCAIFCPPNRIGWFLSNEWRLLAWVSANPVARKNVSPRYGIQPIAARGPFPKEYGLDWYKHRSNIQTPSHPHEKPLGVMRWLIETMCPPGATVLDPFMGSGTTGVACVETGRNFIGIEIDPEYFAIAERRIAEAQRNFQPQLTLA